MAKQTEDIAAIEDEGKTMFIVRRQPDGIWRIARLIPNSDQPPAGSQ